MKEKIKYLLGTIWLVTVMYFYYKNHSYFTEDFSSFSKWWALWLAPILGYVVVLFANWATGRQEIQFVLNIKRIVVGLFLSMLAIGNIAFMVMEPVIYTGPTAIYEEGIFKFNPSKEEIENAQFVARTGVSIANVESNSAFEQISQYMVKPGIWDIEKGLFLTYTKVYVTSAIFLFFCFGLGTRIHKIIRRKEEHDQSVANIIIEMTLGLGAMTLIFMVLAAIGQFRLPLNLGIIAILAVWVRHELIAAFNGVKNFEKEIRLPFSNLELPLLIIILTFGLIHFFDNLSPMPRGWDGLNRYVLNAKYISETGSLVKIGSVYAWELIMAFFYSIDSKIALFWTALPGILNFAAIYIILRHFASRITSILVIAFLISMPMMSFYLSDENKIDLAHWLLGSSVILCLLKGLSFDQEIKIKDYSYLWVAGLLAGFAFTVKFTGIMLVFTLFTIFAFLEGGILAGASVFLLEMAMLIFQGGLNIGSQFITSDAFNASFPIYIGILGLTFGIFGLFSKKIGKNAMRNIIIMAVMVALPIMPWIIKNGIEGRTLKIDILINGVTEKPLVDLHTVSSMCNSTAFYEEFDRYLGYGEGIFAIVAKIPWHLTMNDTGASGAYVDIGFAFLGFALFGILFFGKDKKKTVLACFALLYAFFWIVRANGVIWYGFPLMTFAAILLVIAFNELEKKYFGRIILCLAAIIWLTLAFGVRAKNFGNAILMVSHTGLIPYQLVQENIFPYADDMEKYLKENPGIIYKIGTPLGFYIPDSYKRAYEDQLLDDFNCMFVTYKGDPVKMIEIFQENNIKYMLFDSYTSTIGQDPKGTLHAKVDTVLEFINKYLEVVIYDEVRGYHLLYIPTKDELLSKHPELAQ